MIHLRTCQRCLSRFWKQSVHCRSLHRSNLKKAFDTVNHEILLDKLNLFISFFLYLITSTIYCGIHNRAGLQLKCVLTDNPPSPGEVDYTNGIYVPYSFRIVVWVLLRPTRTNQWKCCETGPYPRKLESLIVCRCHCKGALSPQLF